MKNVFMDTNCTLAEFYDNKYSFVGEYCFGRRIVGICTDKMRYAIALKGEVVSPWFDKITIMPSFNVCQKDGKSFLTSANGKEVISDEYKEIGRFEKIGIINKYYAKAKNFDGKYGTVCSDGKVCIEFINKELARFGAAYAVCGRKFENGVRYALFAVNGERVCDYEYVKYNKNSQRICFETPEGKTVIYNVWGRLIRK